MNMKSLVPWGRERRDVPVRREQDNPFYSLQRSINQVFDNFLFEGFGQSPFGVYASFSPRLDASETDKEFRVTAESRHGPERRGNLAQRFRFDLRRSDLRRKTL